MKKETRFEAIVVEIHTLRISCLDKDSPLRKVKLPIIVQGEVVRQKSPDVIDAVYVDALDLGLTREEISKHDAANGFLYVTSCNYNVIENYEFED